jgi:hypothetical protein
MCKTSSPSFVRERIEVRVTIIQAFNVFLYNQQN